MLQPKPKFTPPSDAVVVESGNSFVPPSDAIVLKKKESTESTSTIQENNGDSVQEIGSSGTVGFNGFPAIDKNLGVPGLKPDLKTVDQLANPPKSNTDSTKPIKKFEGLIPDKTKGFYRQGEENVEDKKYIDEGFSNKTEYVAEEGKLVPKTKTTYVSEATKNLKANYAKEIGRKSISEYDPNLTEENLQREKEQSGVLNTLGKVGKYVLNATGESLSAWNEALGGDEGYFTIDQYEPLQDQKKQAKKDLQREGLPITEEAIQKRAEDIFRKEDRIQQIQKRVDANLPEDYDREGIWKELKLDNLKNNDKLRSAVATIDINKKQIDDFNKYAAYVNSLPKEKITQDKVDKYNKLLAEAQDSSESLEYYQKTFPKLLKEVKSSDELLDVMKFNYNDYEKAYSNITGLGKTIAMGSLKLAGETANYTDQILGREGQDTGYRQAIIDVANEELDKNTKDKEQYIRYKAKDINSFSDGGSFMAQLGTEQLPVYATLVLAPGIGLPLLGSGTAGEQFRNMEVEEMQPFAKQTTFGQKLATAYLYGSAETLFERLGTVSVLKNIEKSIARASNASRKLIYEGAAKESTKLAKRLGLNTAIEGGTEYLTAEAQIGADKYVSGKNISSQQANERRFESTVAGGLMGGSMTLMGGVWGSIAQKAKLYSENKDIKETKAILSQIDLLSDELKNNPNLNAEDKKIIYDKMNDLTNKSFDIVIKNSEKGKNFSAKENQFLVDINVKQDQLKQKFEELKNSNISTEQKELLVKDLNNQYAQLEKDRNSTLKGEFETIPDIRKIITFQKKEEDNLKDDQALINKAKPKAEVQEPTNEQKVAQLRADEQAENAEIEKRKQDFITTSTERKGSELNDAENKAIEAQFDAELAKVYDKYDKLITPLLEAETKPTSTKSGDVVAKKPSEKQETSSEQKIAEIEKRRVDTESKIKRKDLFIGVGEFSSELGGSDKAAVPVSHKEKNGIEFVEYAHPETGSVDVIVTGKSNNDFVGFYRIYENGKPTNKWSSKFENQSRNKEDFKTMISGVQEMLPQGHEYTEKSSISTDGLRVWEQQLSRGYELQYDKNGKLITNLVAINGDAIVNELGIPVQKGEFENIKVKSQEEFEVVKKALLPYLEKLGLGENDIRWLTGTVKINLPVLKSTKETPQAETNEKPQEVAVTEQIVEAQPQAEVPQQAEAEKVATPPVEDVVASNVDKEEDFLDKFKREQELEKKVNAKLLENELNPIDSYESTLDLIDTAYLEPTPYRINNIAKELNIELPQESGGGFLRAISLSGGAEYKNIQEWLDNAKEIANKKIAEANKIKAEIIKENEATSPTNNPVNGNLSTRTSDVGESGTTKQQSPAKENLPSSVERGKSESNTEVSGKEITPRKEVNDDVETVKKELKLDEIDSLIYDEFNGVPEDQISKKFEKVKDDKLGEIEKIESDINDIDIKLEDNSDAIDKIEEDETLSSAKKKKAIVEKEKEYKELQKQQKELEVKKEVAEKFLEDFDNRLFDFDYDYKQEVIDKVVDRVNTRLETRKAVKSGTDLFPETANIPEISKQVEFNAKNIENKGDSVDKQVSVATKQGQSRPVTDLDIAKSNLKFALKAKEEAEEYLKTTAKNPFADKVQYNKDKLADAKKRIRNLKLEINSLESPTIKEEIAKKVIFKYEGKDVVKVEDITTSKGDKYKKIIFSDEKNQIVSEDKFNSIEKTEIQETPNRKESRKKIAEAKVDDIVNAINGIDSIFGIKIKVDDVDGLNKNGIDIVNVIASIVKQAVNAGIDVDEAIKKTIEHLKKTIVFDVNINDVKEKLGVEKPKSKNKNPLREKSSEEIADELGISHDDYLDLKGLVANEPSSGIFNEYLSAETIADVFGDEPTNNQQYEQMVLLNAVQHGNSVLEKARSIFGENYMSKTLEFLQNVKLGNFEKAMVYAALENEIDTLVKANPSNKVFLATQRLIYADSQANLRNSSKGLNAGRLRRIHNAIKNGYDIDKLTSGLIKPEQQEAKQILKDAIPTGDNLNKASEQEENEIDSEERIYTQNELDEAIEKARREFEEENLGFEIRESKVKIKKEDALEQIRKIKDNWKKASKDGTLSASLPYAKQIIAVAPDVIKLAKLYSQIAGMKTIDIVQAIRNDVSEVFDLISEKDIKGILKKEYGAKSRKMSEATKRKIYVKLLNKAIESLDAQIEKRSRDVVKKVDKYANDSEIQNLRDLKKQRQEELEKIDPSYSDKKKLSNAIDSVNKSISELENKIADSNFSEKQKEVKEVDKKLAELREKRDSLRKEYNKRKDEYKKSLVSEDEKRKMQESQKITVLEKRLQDLKDKKAKDTLGKSSVWNAEISDLQNQIKQEKQRQEEPKKPKIKDVVKQALIDAGFSREITVTKNAKDANGNDIIDSDGKKQKVKETKEVLDWNKLTGRMNSVEALKANVEGKLKEQGYTDSQIEEISNELETEYKRLTEYIADKALTELERRNQIPKPVNRKSDLDRLVDYHNKGLFGESAKGYERLINKIVGITKREQDVLDKIESEIEKIKNLREVKIDGSFPDAQSIESQASHIAKSIRNIIAWSNLMNSRIDKQIIDVISDIAGISRAAVLGNLYNAFQNIYSNNRAGFLARMKFKAKGYWTPELNDVFNELKKSVTSDVLINRGLDFGDVVSPFSNHSIFIEKLKDYIEKKYPEGRKRRMIIGALNTFEGRLFLNVMDSRFKSKIVNIDFVMNLVDVLTSERAGKSKMTKEDAVNFVSESLTGVNLEKAKVLAKKFINDVNAMKENTLLENEDNIKRLAFDIVRENLTSGNNFTMDEINDIYQASMKSGGANIGHESNNIISESLKNLNNWIEKKVEDAMKEKDYDKATKYATYAFISKNITYPYMSGGFNWVVLEAEAGTPLGLATGAYKSYKNKNIDLLTDVGKKRMKEDLINKRDAESKLFRGIWGTSIGVAAYLAYYGLQAVSGVGDDDEENKRISNKYLREHPEQRKIFDKFSPEVYAVSLAVSDERLSKYLLNKMGYKTDQNDNVLTLLKSLQNKNSSTPGALGVLLGQIVSTPGAWRILRDSKRLFRELQGEPMAQTEQRVTSFLNGYFKGALVDYLGLRPGTNYDLEKVKKEIQNKKTDFTNYTNGIANDINSGKITKEDAAKLVNKKYEDNDELLDKAKEIIQNSVNDKEIREGLKDADIWYMEMHNEKDIRAKAYIYYQNELKNNASKTDKNFDEYMNIALYGIDEDYYKKFIDLAIEYKDVEEQKSKKKPIN